MTELIDIFREVIDDQEQLEILEQIEKGKSFEEIVEEQIGFQE